MSLACNREEVSMAKNTGHGYRHGAVTGRTQVKTPSGYVKRDSGTGRFMDVKSDNKPFKGVIKEK
jgi:hypothetical protein